MKSIFHAILICFALTGAIPVSGKPLLVDEVLTTVRQNYPPLLGAWLQQDIANGRVRQAQGAFDPILSSTLGFSPLNYYDGTDSAIFLDQPLAAGGANIYGGYRLSSGFLPDYERKSRTADGGEAVIGLRMPLLRDRDIDNRRANLTKAQLDKDLANPFILRQYLDFHRASRISYFNWVAAGKRLNAAEQLLKIAKERDDSIKEKVKMGAMARITETDNQRLVISREISVLNSIRNFEASAITLSLFHRDVKSGDPIIPGRERLPEGFPEISIPNSLQLTNDRGRAAFRRPEGREIELLIAKITVDRRLATNNLKPNLDLALELNQALGSGRPSDIDAVEMTGLLRFSIPIGQDEAKGRLQAINGEIGRLEQQKKFTRDRILADADDAHSAMRATYAALERAGINVELAKQLEAAENEKFRQGASDLLALQIREQASFDAQVLEIDAKQACFRAMADYQAAIAADAPTKLTSRNFTR